MKLTTLQIEHAARVLHARPVPENSRMAPDLMRWFGEHTFFLGDTGLHILEPAEITESGAETGRLVRVASWTDSRHTALATHAPKATEVFVQLHDA